MSMQQLNLVQGSEEWKAVRRKYLVASEAPIIMGASPNIKRDELLRMKTTGDEQEISHWTQLIFDKGHEVEAKARPIVQELIGEALFPIVAVREVEGLNLLASFDGITMLESDIWECKQFNRELYEIVSNNGNLTGKHFWQLEHQCLVSGLDSVTFTCSDGTEENTVTMTYHSEPERSEQLIHGWKLFIDDLNGYEVIEVVEAPQGKALKALPALIVEVKGGVQKSNLPEFRQHALEVFGSINTELSTDENFADAELSVKWCSKVEEKLELTKSQVLAQTVDIEALFLTIDELKATARKTRLDLSKKVTERKVSIRAEIAKTAQDAWKEHLNLVNKNLGDFFLPSIAVDIPGAMKGKRTILTLRCAANDEVARAKIEANRIAESMRTNIAIFDKLTVEHAFLFQDKAQLIGKDSDSLEAIIKTRVIEHEAAEQKKRDDAIEAQRIKNEAAEKLLLEQQSQPEPEVATESTPALQESSQVVETVRQTETHQAQPQSIAPSRPFSNSGSRNQQQATPGIFRPSNQEIIVAVAAEFGVDETVAKKWLSEFSLQNVA